MAGCPPGPRSATFDKVADRGVDQSDQSCALAVDEQLFDQSRVPGCHHGLPELAEDGHTDVVAIASFVLFVEVGECFDADGLGLGAVACRRKPATISSGRPW